jgi:phosphate:Na+ symporter
MLLEILSLIGAVCLFLYGMRQISDSLQKLTGKRMRTVIHKLTNTRGRGFFSGFFLTSLIQTSSASTLLIVSLVNAGVISLLASVPMIIGANVGTTVKLWLISYLGFQFDIGPYFLVLLAIGFPFLFFKTGKLKNIGEFLIGLSLLFLGLYYMKSVFPEADEHSFFYSWVQSASQAGYAGVLLFVALGFIITAIIQSSSAAITLTIVLCYQGVIGFPLAVAMVLGQNIGTTITVNIGALLGDTNSKRAALSHLIMNLISVLLVLPFFYVFTDISSKVALALFNADVADPHDIPVAIAFVHTLFNLILALIMLPAVRLLIRLCEGIIPQRKIIHKRFRLLEDNFFSTSEMSVIHVKTGIARFALYVSNSMKLLPALLSEKKDKKFSKLFEEIKEAEETADRTNNEIADYLSRVSERDISRDSSRNVLKLLEISDNVEYLSDLVFQFAKTIELKNSQKAWFTQEMRDTLSDGIRLVNDAADIMLDNLSSEFSQLNIDSALEKHELVLRFVAEEINGKSAEKINSEIPKESVLFYKQMLSFIERLSESVFNVSKIIIKSANGHRM